MSKICQNCQKTFEDDTKFCDSCGAELTAAEVAAEEVTAEEVVAEEAAAEEITETAEAVEAVEEILPLEGVEAPALD